MMMIKEVEVGNVVHQTADYAVRIDAMEDPDTGNELVVYGIINKITGVREAELRGYTGAVAWCNRMQHEMNDLKDLKQQEELLFNEMPAYHEDREEEDEEVPVDLLAKLDGE